MLVFLGCLWPLLAVGLCDLYLGLNVSSVHEDREVCEFQRFTARCGRDEVVLMTSAQYGRMKVGSCVNDPFGYVGCSKDVLDLADRMCSGRRSCNVSIPNPEFASRKACHSELRSYLKASFVCVKAQPMGDRACRSCDHFSLNAPEGVLTSHATLTSGCGAPDCPWLIVAEPGRRINLTLLDFGDSSRPGNGCRVYATIRETKGTKRETICGGDGRGARRRNVYTSDGNELQLRVVGKDDQFFVVHYNVFGCADPAPPAGSSGVERHDGHALVRCENGAAGWELRCVDGLWTGRTGSCESDSALSTGELKIGSITISSSVSIAIILVIALCIGVVILSVGLYILRRSKRSSRPVLYETTTESSQSQSQYAKNSLSHAKSSAQAQTYRHIWEMPLPDPRSGRQRPPPPPPPLRGDELKQQEYGRGSTKHEYAPGMSRNVYEVPQDDDSARYYHLMAERTGTL